MADTVELAFAICKLIQSSPAPIPVTLMNHSIREVAAIIGAVIDQCDRNGVKIDQVCVDPELSTQLGLTEGATLPHGCRPTVHVEPGLGRQLLFKRGQWGSI
jgi:hypothetical protein